MRPADPNDDPACLSVQVLPAWRHRGIGTARADQSPGHPSVTTFNAEENRHMLAVNEALGFGPMRSEGVWKRFVPPVA
ncbi:hypothetical protein [Cryobacterium serini]|uniref:GNAT family N-acetyltransferase n=1 Tax=Cryobacterium serini TaxID=1259201 RepID=A0A4R9BQL8_9MICO|nr:hypothetical protein [Cryobacterium serini]TFD88830.1 hypothetical protein E3T51_05665 [Cryobacterium serini]